MLADLVTDENSYGLQLDDAFLLYPHMAERDYLSHVSSYEVTKPIRIHEDFTLMTSFSPKGPISKNYHIGDYSFTIWIWGVTNIQSTAMEIWIKS